MIKGFFEERIDQLAKQFDSFVYDLKPEYPKDAIIINENIFCENSKIYAVKMAEKLCKAGEISTVKILHDYVSQVTYKNVAVFTYWEHMPKKWTYEIHRAFHEFFTPTLYYCRCIYNPANAFDFTKNLQNIKKFNVPKFYKESEPILSKKKYGVSIYYNRYYESGSRRLDFITEDISEFSDLVIYDIPIFDDVALKMVVLADGTRIFNSAEHELVPIHQGYLHLLAMPRFIYINYILAAEKDDEGPAYWKHIFDVHLELIKNSTLPMHLNGYVGKNKSEKRIYDRKPETLKPYLIDTV